MQKAALTKTSPDQTGIQVMSTVGLKGCNSKPGAELTAVGKRERIAFVSH